MMRFRVICLLCVLTLLGASQVAAREFHVSMDGDDSATGAADAPLRSISAAAERAQPGDVITVHAGVYRERINPPRGGISDEQRITYRANPGDNVVIKGSEIIQDWSHVQNETWKVILPNSFFGDFNPYDDLIYGDWFNPLGREHHTGAVYLGGHWLTEASSLEEVLAPVRDMPLWAESGIPGFLLNVAWFQVGDGEADSTRIPAAGFAAHQGIQTTEASEGGECIGWIEDGDWVRYDDVDFGDNATELQFRAASATDGGRIEVRLDAPDGALLGTANVENTGDWQIWSTFSAEITPLDGQHTICLVFRHPDEDMEPDAPAQEENTELWFAEVDDRNTTIWAQFQDIDPNEAEVEINVRQTVFYPEATGMDYLTVRGFTMMHAATPWAPPTAEQIGLIGTNWSKGWIIEDNDIRYSTCVGITLGKYGDAWDNTSENTAEGYVDTIHRALENGWRKDNIGHHVVRNNRIAHCEQAGLVGSLGAIFSTISHNTIHDIHVRRLFTGAEMGGIKLHAPIDTLISNNHIYRTARGIWLDWMAQGSRVTGNLLHDNSPLEDLFMEVNHGPYVIDNNICLSPTSLNDWSQGGAYAHNLFNGRIVLRPELSRETPYHPPHSTELAGLKNIPGGDTRFYNNLFTGGTGLPTYDETAFPMYMVGNLFLGGAVPSVHESDVQVAPDFDLEIRLIEAADAVYLEMTLDADLLNYDKPLVNTELLGEAVVPDLPFLDTDGSTLVIDSDYFGVARDADNPQVGPFEQLQDGQNRLQVWDTSTE